MRMFSQRVVTRQFALGASVSLIAMALAANAAIAQGTDIGSVNVESSAHKAKAKPVRASRGPANNRAPVAAPAPAGPAIQSDAAIGNKAPIGSAPALAPSQASLNSYEPGSVVSDKVIKDIVVPGGDYNEAGKYTAGFYSANPNGAQGDSNSGWRGFADGQFNITFDGIPFGDANDPSHHSAAYFPSAFLGKVVIDRGPGEASQVGYATFGGTMALYSRELSDKFGGQITGSIGNNGTYTGSVTMQSGLVMGDTRAMLQYSYAKTDGALTLGHVDSNQFLGKVEKQMGEVTATFFATYGRQNYNNTSSPTWAQLQTYGNKYGELNRNPLTAQYTGYNNSQKETDMEYVKLDGDVFGFHFANQLYTYAYTYPSYQNNANDQTIEGPASIANGATITVFKVPNPAASCTAVMLAAGCKTSVTFAGVVNGDVTGYLKFNNYRGYGDILKLSHDIDAGFMSGQLRFGAWAEHVDNGRYQQFYDYTQGKFYSALSPSITAGNTTPAQDAIDLANAAYKLNLNSHITNLQPYVEYEWKPVAGLSITPGFKYESFARDHDGQVNQKTLQPVSYSKTYTASLPYLAVRYKVLQDLTVYAQASKGFLAPQVAAYYVFDFNANNISPEETTNYQAGAVYKTVDLTVSADVYQITATNFPVTTTAADGTPIYVNAGTARYQGIEAEGTYALGNVIGGFAQGFGVYASGALSNAKFVGGPNTGLAVPNAPRYTVAGGLLYDNGMFFGSLLHKITGDQYGSGGQVASTATVNGQLNHVAAYNTTDFVMGVRSDFLKQMGVGEKAEFKVGVSNIFDHHDFVDIGGTPSKLTAAADSLTYTSLAGRVYYAGMKVDF